MKLKKFYEYNNTIRTNILEGGIDVKLIEWLNLKLGIKIGKRISNGQNGIVYNVNNNRVMKISDENIEVAQYISSKKLEGIIKIYQTGHIIIPKRLNITVADGTVVGYTIMERIYNDAELSSRIDLLDTHIWYNFTDGSWEKDDGGNYTFNLNDNKYSDSTITTITDNQSLGTRNMLLTLSENVDNIDLINDIKEFILNYDFGTLKYRKELIMLLDRLVLIFKNIKLLGINWLDIHSEQFGYNSKNEVVAFDIDSDIDSTDIPSGKKIKNVIRERKIIQS